MAHGGSPWMVQDAQTNGLLHVLISAVYGFRMPLFFVLSGFSTAMLWLRVVIAHRFKRVYLPLLLGTLTFAPVMFLLDAVAARSGERESENEPPTLWKACADGDLDLVRRLLDEGAEANELAPALGVTPFSHAALFDRDEIARLLLQRGADTNRTNRDGGTAFHGAAFLGRADIVRYTWIGALLNGRKHRAAKS